MMVDSSKLETIARAISEQAGLLRKAGRIAQADGMEKRARELRMLVAAWRASRLPAPALHAA
ncbi:MAG: hypothetical protein Kow0026_03470 [Oricola sp.]